MGNDRAGRILFWAILVVIIVGFVGSFRVKADTLTGHQLVQGMLCDTQEQMVEAAEAILRKDEAAFVSINERAGTAACGMAQVAIGEVTKVVNARTYSVYKVVVVGMFTPMGLVPVPAMVQYVAEIKPSMPA